MIFILVVLGGLLGFGWDDEPGLVVGALLGWLIGAHVQLRTRMLDVEKKLSASPSHAPRSEPASPPLTSAPASSSLSAEPEPPMETPTAPIAAAAHNAAPALPAPVAQPASSAYSTLDSQPEPDWFAGAAALAKRYFLGGNTVVRVGVLILFFGIAFLLKFAAEHNKLPAEFRLIGAGLGSIALLIVGWRLRDKRREYAVALQGGGIGIFYLTVFAALRLYQLIPASATLLILVAICVSSATLALLQNSVALAVLGAAGGFLAPVLTSTGGGSHVMLFSYYALLNTGVLGLAWFKAWRLLNLVGFTFTFVIGAAWGMKYYQPAYFASTEPFLILFFLFYVAIAVLFAHRQPLHLRGYVDGTLVFGTPIVGFVLQAGLVRDFPYGMAFSALTLGAFYIGLGSILWRHSAASMRTLTESFLALGVVFATLAVPLALDGQWTAAVWAIEGAGLYWVGQRQHRKLPQVFGALLQPAAGILFLRELSHYAAPWPWLNSHFVGCALLAAAGIFLGFRAHRFSKWSHAGTLSLFMLIWGALWWLLGGYQQIDHHVPYDFKVAAGIAYLAMTALVAERAGARFQWTQGRNVALALLPMLAGIFVMRVEITHHVFGSLGWAAWPTALVVWFLILYQRDRNAVRTPMWAHYAGAWLLGLIAVVEINWQTNFLVDGGGDWARYGWGVVPAIVLWIAVKASQWNHWPFNVHQKVYRLYGGAGAAVIGALWLFASGGQAGDPAPLPYAPLLNPLDLSIAFYIVALIVWLAPIRTNGELPILFKDRWDLWWVGGGLFVWLNAMLLRSMHHYADIPHTAPVLFHSVLVQAALSLFWTVIAVAMMVYATRRGERTIWIAGAVLQAIVVAKLFFLELANTGTMARIVSFIGVGILLLAVGYLAPVPPRRTHQETDS